MILEIMFDLGRLFLIFMGLWKCTEVTNSLMEKIFKNNKR